MRKYLCILIVLVIACASPGKLLRKGNYDAAIDKSVKKIMKKPDAEDEAIVLDKAYKLANERDRERIKYLKLEGNPDTWDEIYYLYSALKNRQSKVRPVLPIHVKGRTINYEYIDYDREIVEAKNNAADYYFEHAVKLMDQNTKEGFRQAYIEFVQANQLAGTKYENIDLLMDEARYLGISRALVQVANQSGTRLPEDFLDHILLINTDGLDSEWVEYHLRPMDDEIDYDYIININLNIVDVSPEMIDRNEFMREKTMEDGFDYVLDARGNVMKDTLGNDIKIKRYKDISCTMIEQYQRKTATIEGEVEFNSLRPFRLLKKEPVGASSHFEHVSGRAIGEIEALEKKDRRLLGVDPLPFPDDMEMIYECTEGLQAAISDVIRRNRQIIR